MQAERHLTIASRRHWAGGVFFLVMVFASFYGLATKGHHWIIWLFLVVSLLVAIYAFVPSYLTLDYDRDFIETRIWRLTYYDSQSKHGLRNIESILLEVRSGGENGPSYFEKYVIFKDGQKIQLPSVKDIEKIVVAWYKRYLRLHVPIEQDGEIRTASRRAEIILFLVVSCTILALIFGGRVWNLYFAEISIRDEQVICQGSDCDVTFRVINRSAVDKSQEFYVGVWPRLASETDTRYLGELGFSRTLVNLKPHETKHRSVRVKLTHPRYPEGEYALVQKAWW